ncbi:type I-C CRISPR-associated protein Cas8c/Csd1 [Desulfovibrio inopinatus]|uniref:type I-C CRISPR-associated protein Cas8c/Csd1 n=1 Tax=Desulfovibrio inopinatus TaxID=102109 RepID=UPI0004220BC2|nr:type I-C CRISPR-associated protein Cas8c/Csd1 [Desulfovibrio inopinatus]
MLVQALAEYAHTYLTEMTEHPQFEEKPVRFWVDIREDGSFLSISEHTHERPAGKNKDGTDKMASFPDSLLVPKSPVNRNSGVFPLLGCDSAEYVFPAEYLTDGKMKPRDQQKNADFVALLRHAAIATNDPMLAACVAFYKNEEAVKQAAQEYREQKPGTEAVCLAVRFSSSESDSADKPVIEQSAVKTWWAPYYDEAFTKRHEEGGTGMCLVTGDVTSLATTHEKIKGTSSLGGQSAGVSLMAFDKAAFQSYGWKQNANSPVGIQTASAYVTGINDLLRPGKHCRGRSEGRMLPTRSDYEGMAFLYWTKAPEDMSMFGMVDSPDPETIRNLLNAPYTRQMEDALNDIDPDNDFYLLVVSATGARLVVRDWFHERLGSVRDNVRNWLSGLSVPNVFDAGEPSKPVGLYTLLKSLLPPRADPKDSGNSGRAMMLLRRALYGTPLGYEILDAALRRIRIGQQKDPSEKANSKERKPSSDRLIPYRIGLVRMAVYDIERHESGNTLNMEMEAFVNEYLAERPAFVCGRLMAQYENLQYQAGRKVEATKNDSSEKNEGPGLNVSVVDRYFSQASLWPALAFPYLERLSKAHIRRLRSNKREGTAIAISKRISELMEQVGKSFPGNLSLKQQGEFIIGYHTEKAESIRQSKAKNEEKDQQNNIEAS